MNFAELKTEVAARGFDHIDATRRGVLINWAYLELCGLHTWPFLEDFATGTAPLSISDLGTIEAVMNTDLDVELQPAEYRDLVAEYGDLRDRKSVV